MHKYPHTKKGLSLVPALSPLSTAIRHSLLGLGLVHGASHAATVEVTSNADNGTACTLREAVVSINTQSRQTGCANISTNAFGVNDHIVFSTSLAGSNTISLTGTLDIEPNRSVTITAGNIAGGVTLDANQRSRVMYASSATLRIENLTIRGGSNTGSGGGVAGDSYATLVLSNTTVSGNTARFGGGVFAGLGTSITLINSTVSGNSAYLGGGGLFSGSASPIKLFESTVSGNSARVGAGLDINNSNLVLDRSMVSGNSASGSGGGLNISNSDLTLKRSTVLGNSAVQSGGGLYLDSSNATIVQTKFVGNIANLQGSSASSFGGGIGAKRSSISMNNSTISENFAIRGSGTTLVYSSLYAQNSTFSRNTASAYGGAILGVISTASLRNSTVSGNSSIGGEGAAVYVRGTSSLNLSNSTVSNNSSGGLGSIEVYNSSVHVSNSIITDSVGSGDCYTNDYSTMTIDNATIIEDGSCGAGRSGDPGLLPLSNNGGLTQTHALKANSIARNSGVLSGATGGLSNCSIRDQRGQLRNDGDGLCDVGAIEFNVNDDDGFFVLPLKNGKVVVIPL